MRFVQVFVSVLVLSNLFSSTLAKIYFSETFDADWEKRWVLSKNKESEGTQGKWDLSPGKYYNNRQQDKGLHTSEDARFYQITAGFEEFSNRDKTLYVQYSVKHEQRIDCGGGYIKLHPKTGMNQEDYNGDTPYNIMFGPDICGSSTRKTHLIFQYKGENNLIKKDVKCESDEFTHLYTLVLKPDNTYEIKIDNKEVASGNLKEDWDMLPPKEIPDPDQKKPTDWVDEKMIPDPSDKKPEGWDDIPAEIPDPDAKKPEDWDDELDGEWEPPVIDNPKYKGEWSPKMIENPAYKGEWVHPKIPNPKYVDDDSLYAYDSNAFVGFELWQVKSGTIFDNIVITDDSAVVEDWSSKFATQKEGEKAAFDKAEEERKAKEEEERKKAEEEALNKQDKEDAATEENKEKDEL